MTRLPGYTPHSQQPFLQNIPGGQEEFVEHVEEQTVTIDPALDVVSPSLGEIASLPKVSPDMAE